MNIPCHRCEMLLQRAQVDAHVGHFNIHMDELSTAAHLSEF